MERKTFIKKMVGALIVTGPALTLLNCSSSDDSSSGSNNNNNYSEFDCLANGTSTSISSNHGHSLTVSREDVEARTEKEYSIQGGSGHSHLVTVTSGNFDALASNQSVTVQSTTGNSHAHSVTISCA